MAEARSRLLTSYTYVSFSHTAILLLFVAAAGLVLASLYLILTRAFTKAILHITLVLTILLNMYVILLTNDLS